MSSLHQPVPIRQSSGAMIVPRPDVATHPERWDKTPRSLVRARPDLKPIEKVCIQAIRSYDQHGFGCKASNATLMVPCGIKDRGSMSRLIAQVERKGEIWVELVDADAGQSNRAAHPSRPTSAGRKGRRPKAQGRFQPPLRSEGRGRFKRSGTRRLQRGDAPRFSGGDAPRLQRGDAPRGRIPK